MTVVRIFEKLMMCYSYMIVCARSKRGLLCHAYALRADDVRYG